MSALDSGREARLARAIVSLDGLSIGDAFGQQVLKSFKQRVKLAATIAERDLEARMDQRAASVPWPWTDDTALAIEVVAVLREHGTIDSAELAARFARRYRADPARGYGGGMHELLPRLADRDAWRTAPRELFDGAGSFGNGAAMRVAPLGAYFADDLAAAAREAEASAEITHTHEDGIAGAVAVSLATAHAVRGAKSWLADVRDALAPGRVRDGIERALAIAPEALLEDAVGALGNGFEIAAHDTVPLCLWIAQHHGSRLSSALKTTARCGGDVDTTCAIVGGVVAAASGLDGVAKTWLARREPLIES